jgi:hypothetical protein
MGYGVWGMGYRVSGIGYGVRLATLRPIPDLPLQSLCFLQYRVDLRQFVNAE